MIKLPSDTVAEILSSGLLGDKYLALVPGAADDVIPPGGEINSPIADEPRKPYRPIYLQPGSVEEGRRRRRQGASPAEEGDKPK